MPERDSSKSKRERRDQRRERGEADRGGHDTGEPGGADPDAEPFDEETHAAGGGSVELPEPRHEEEEDED